MRLSPRGGPGWWLGALALAVALAALGCGGGGKATISGKVTYKGATLKAGRVTYAGSDKRSLTSDIGEDGTYTVAGVASGPAKISVQTSYMKNIRGKSYKVPPDAPPGYSGGIDPALRAKYVLIPENYEDPEKSGLTFDVKGGTQSHDIELK
jgi:hypothetical protein